MALQVFDPYRTRNRLTKGAYFSAHARAGGLCLLLWVVPLIGYMEVASAEAPSDASGPELPAPSMLRPGKLLRGPEGTPILVPPNNPTTTNAAPASLPDPQASTAKKGAKPIADGPSPPASPSAAKNKLPSLPPPATSKAVTPRRLAGGGLAAVPRVPRTLMVCPPQAAKPDCDYLSLSDALAQAKPGDTVLLAPGIYQEAAFITVDRLTIKGEPGAHLKGRAVGGKAALVVRANDVIVDGIECSGIRVRDRNGACIRVEGDNLTVRNVYFHDNQEGLLSGPGGGTLLVENSRFVRNGFNNGRAHGLYISNNVETFIFRNNQILATKRQGQGLKSRAKRTIIENNIIAGLDARDSRAIDIPNGGEIIIRRNILQKGPNSSNSQMIGLGLEGRPHTTNSALIEENVIIFDQNYPNWVDMVNQIIPIAPPRGTVVYSKMAGPITLSNNVIVSAREIVIGAQATMSGNRSFATRSQAGLPKYPELPISVSEFMTPE